MAIDKDYYAILGVHPTAEIAVIEVIFCGFCKKVTSDMKKTEGISARMLQEIKDR